MCRLDRPPSLPRTVPRTKYGINIQHPAALCVGTFFRPLDPPIKKWRLFSRRLQRFLRTIVQKPELATYVHNVVLNGNSFDKGVDDPGNESPRIPVAETLVNELVELVTRINVPYAKEWIQKLRAGSMDAFTTLFI
ncbi:hypothetical protein PITC_022220 [Penicillium italicum]|uniref:Uncharacterized protein n=1 Tax=Penicillium italicum TaxID=40296 RepID=A0A0A2L2E2_PENIT|nr:hypothetical protein PITC_022220 [Penicillium italicum]